MASDGPVLCLCIGDVNKVYFGGDGQNQVTGWDLATNESYFVGAHAAPVSFAHYYAEKNALITGSWDKTIRFWDTRASASVGMLSSSGGDRIYCGHVLGYSAVIATADRKVVMLDLRHPQGNFITYCPSNPS